MATTTIDALSSIAALAGTDEIPVWDVSTSATKKATITDIVNLVPSGTGTVTSASVVSANGLAGSVADATTTPAITLSTTVTGVVKGNGTSLSAATAGTDYSAGTSALATGILKSTTTTGALTIATGADLPVMTATVGGAVPTPPNNTTTFLRGDGTFATPVGAGTVTDVSVVSANGFAGTVATSTSTPAITLTTSITGLLKGNATAISAASAGTDYVAPGGALGTPSSGTLTSCTGLPVSTGISGFGTGVATALAVNVGSAGAPVVLNGALGTPSSGTLSSCTADGTNAVGFRTIPQNSQSAAYTTVLADSGKHILHPAADTNARTFTIDSNANVAYPVGTAITFINETANIVTIAITTDTLTLAGSTTTGSRSLAQNGVATAIKVTTTKWIISGTGLT